MSTILDIQDVRMSFSKARKPDDDIQIHNVIDGLNMQVEEGKVTALIGGNGAGKTTLFNIVSGLLRPESGSVHFHASSGRIECCATKPWQIATAGIGRMFQGTRVFGELSIEDHMLIQARQGKGEQAFERFLRFGKYMKSKQLLLEHIGEQMQHIEEFRQLWKERKYVASDLSYARQRLLSLAGLYLGGYELLLLDEPTSGLNTDSFDTLHSLINSVREKGKTLLIIEHNLRFIEKAADNCHFMNGGKIEISGTPDSVLGHKAVRESYLL